jgi:hypothetical protein
VNIRHTLIASLLPLVSVAALAADPADSESVSRASVKASVISARAAHQLRPAGDAADYYVTPSTSKTSTLTRAEVNQEVREARIDGLLRPAGEAESYTVARGPLTWDRSRAEVKADVLEARAHGDLIPAGEGQPSAVEATAACAQTFHRLAGGWRKLRGAQ